jgi:hypothetical protein
MVTDHPLVSAAAASIRWEFKLGIKPVSPSVGFFNPLAA